MGLITLFCDFCNEKIQKLECQRHKHNYCNIQCKNNHQSILNKGDKNPLKKAILKNPDLLKGKNNPRYIDGRSMVIHYCKCGSIKDNRSKVCKNCDKHSSFLGKRHSLKTKRVIGAKSALKFTEEFKKKLRNTMEKKGYWIPLNELTDFKIYYKLSNWVEKMFNYASSIEIDLLKRLGVFNAQNNSKGVVRDHRYSRLSGYKKRIFPELLRHPCNCKIITHSANVSKKSKRYIDKDSITQGQLFKLIRQFKGQWKEQEKCLELISLYESGKKWVRL